MLLNHVIDGEAFSEELDNISVTTMNGQKVNITVTMAGSADGNGTGNMTDNTTGTSPVM